VAIPLKTKTASRVLHVVEKLDRGAIENWLLRMLVHARARRIGLDWTFYCAVGLPGVIDEKIRGLGTGIVYSPVSLGRKVAFMRALRAELSRGAYDVLHCHHDLMSAVYLAASAGLPIRRRLVHVHNADEALPTPSPLKNWLYREPMRQLCLRTADRVVGISNHTLDTFLAGRRRRPGRDVVHYYGVDPQRFADLRPHKAQFRRELELADDALILLFGGRMVREKNPVFTVDVLAALRRREPRAVAVFAGSGALEDAIRARARALDIDGAVRMLGWRSDLPEIMVNSDWFILPHPEHPVEGFGLAVIEAQLGGLRLLISRGVADDPLLPTARFRRLLLSDNADEWAAAAVGLLAESEPSVPDTFAALARSPMDMDRALGDLLGLHGDIAKNE